MYDGCIQLASTDSMQMDGCFETYYLILNGDGIGNVLRSIHWEDFIYCGHIDDVIKYGYFP